MTGVGRALVVAATLGAMAVPESAMARVRYGVFGKINGKKFKATNVEGVGDDCVNGIYNPSNGNIVFSAIECRRKRRRQGVAVKRNYQLVVISCFKGDPDASIVPPYEIPCPGSGYTEAKTGRFGIPRSMATWIADWQQVGLITTSNLRMRIDAFDGTKVRGVNLMSPRSPGKVPPAWQPSRASCSSTSPSRSSDGTSLRNGDRATPRRGR